VTGPLEERPQGDELLVIVGPTASGKSALAMALGARFDGEIIGADSVQIYRGFDIGSGKPSAAERALVPHHLVDDTDPLEPIDAGRFATRAEAAIAEVRARGRLPIVCGGTFLWVKALVYGLAPTAPADPAIRRAHQALVEERGRAALHAILAGLDPEHAARLAPNDTVRVSRALEVLQLTGKPLSVWHAEHRFATVRHRARLLGVHRQRAELDARIEARTRSWLAAGWVEEVQGLIDRGYGQARAMGSVGYRQVREMLTGELPRAELGEAIVRATRTFVRRQRTWLRDQPVRWLEPDPGWERGG
jgi:tRNA dimethylallyltransferase